MSTETKETKPFSKHNWKTLKVKVGKTDVTYFISSDQKEDGSLYPSKIDKREEFILRDGSSGRRYSSIYPSEYEALRDAMIISEDINAKHFLKSSTVKVPEGMNVGEGTKVSE